MEDIQNVRLTSSEITNLWTQFMNDSLSVCFISHALAHVKDQEVRPVLEFALKVAEAHLEKLRVFLRQENYPIPVGFTSEDVRLQAPPLFSDTLLLFYLYTMSILGMTGYAGAVGTSVRADQRQYFMDCNNEAMQLYSMSTEVMLEKGVFSRTPFLHPPARPDFVKHQSFLKGWFGKQRPLNGPEISGIFINSHKLMAKIVLEVAYSQVTESKKLRKYFQRGMELCQSHVAEFTALLTEDNLPSPMRWESEVTPTTEPPFSDKLMLFHVVVVVSAAVGYYGAGLSVCQRRDVAAIYTKMIAEMGLFAEDGANLLIENGWLEQPPMAEDRSALAEH